MVLAIALVPIVFPFLREGFFFGHDALAQVTYAYRMDRALHQGQFPVRWAEPVSPGLGQPLFNYYQVGFHYLVAVVHTVVPGVLTSLEVTAVLLWWGGAGLMFVLCRRLGTLPAAAATGAFALSPYMLVDVFVRAALTEFAALASGVAALLMLDRFLLAGSRMRCAALAICLAVVALCHLPGAMVLAPMFFGHAVWLWAARRTTPARLVAAAASGGLALGLAAFYVGPAILELDLVQIRRLTPEAAYRAHFVPIEQFLRYTFTYDWSFGRTVHDPNDAMPQHVAAIELFLLLAGLVLVVRAAVRRQVSERAIGLAAWVSIALFALFMMSYAAVPIWERLSPLAFLQFPWRYFMLVPIAMGLLAALVVSSIPKPGWQAAAMLLIVGAQVHLYHRNLQPRDYGVLAEWQVDDPDWRASAVARHIEYVDKAFTPAMVVEEPTPVVGHWSVVDGAATVLEGVHLDHRRTYGIDSIGGATLLLHTPYFPGWTATVDGQPASIAARGGRAFMAIPVPPGRHAVDVRFENTPIRTWANGVTVASLAVTIALFVPGRKRVGLQPPRRVPHA